MLLLSVLDKTCFPNTSNTVTLTAVFALVVMFTNPVFVGFG